MSKQISLKRMDHATQPGVTTSQSGQLDLEKQVEFCWKVIQRYDLYVNGSNTKAAILLTFNTFVLGTIVLKSSEILAVYAGNRAVTSLVASLLIATAISAVVSMWYGLNAIAPLFTSSKEPTRYHSLIFFGHVAEFGEPGAYRDAITAASWDALSEDLAKQVHAMAGIAASKFQRLMWSVRWIVFAQLPAILAMIIVAGIFAFLSNQAGGRP